MSHLRKRNWPHCAPASTTEAGHKEATLGNLAPDKDYFYIVGSPGPDAATDALQRFRTPPPNNRPPKDGNVHIWLVGDRRSAMASPPRTRAKPLK